MATDFFVSNFFIPILVILGGLILFRLFAKKAWLNKTIFGLRLEALLTGIIVALIGLYLFSAIFSYLAAVDRVEEHESLQEQGTFSLAFVWSIYYFILYAPFVLSFFVLLLLPLLYVFSRLRLVSALGVLLIVALIAGVNAGLTYLYPGNNWCEANLALCMQRAGTGTLSFGLPVAIGFVVGAKLPVLFSRKNEK